MYSASDLRKGLRIEIDGAPYIITEFHFLKPGKGHSIFNCKLKNLINGTTLTKSFRSNDKFNEARLEEMTTRYSYQDGSRYIFLDNNYEEFSVNADVLGISRFFLVEDVEVKILIHNGHPVGVELPTFIEKEVIQTEPGARGNTATNVMKPAKIEGGYEIRVPLFLNKGDIVKIDTRTGEYNDRVSIARKSL